MKNALIINGHYPYPNRKGQLNGSMVDKAREHLEAHGVSVELTETKNDYVVKDELKKFEKADTIIWQFPIHWMGLPWRVKQYMDEVLTASPGVLFASDGRTSGNPKKNYGGGGLSQHKKYMLSVTFNAPVEAFNDPDEYLLQGKSIDDLLLPIHMTMRFLGMQKLPTFACHDVVKRPDVDKYFQEFDLALAKLTGC